MKHLLFALAIGLTVMGCSRHGQEDNDKNSLKGLGYVNKNFCGDVIYLIENDTITEKVFKPSNLPDKFKLNTNSIDSHITDMKVEFTYKVISDIPQVCPGFYGYDKEIRLISIKKIN